jgi:hypothetical protein
MPDNLIPEPEIISKWLAENPDYVLLVRTCRILGDKLVSNNDFEWPTTLFSEVLAPDWNPEAECGRGLHALAPGQQYPGVWYEEGAWLLVAAKRNQLVNLFDEKYKAPGFTILAIAYTNGRIVIPQLLRQLNVSESVYQAAVADLSDHSVVSVGHQGVAVTGNGGYAEAGYYGTAIGHFSSKAVTEDNGTSFTFNEGTSQSGYCGRSITGYNGYAITGDHGTAIGRNGSFLAAGVGGILQSECWFGHRWRIGVGYIGETLDNKGQALEPNKYYELTNYQGVLCWVKKQDDH